jgi:hypothetical protein
LEKVAKLNEEFQAFSRLGQKETTTEWIIRKRKHQEIEEGKANLANNSKTGAAARLSTNPKKMKPNNFDEA